MSQTAHRRPSLSRRVRAICEPTRFLFSLALTPSQPSSRHGRAVRPLPPLNALSTRRAAGRCDNERSLDTCERKTKGDRVSHSFQSNSPYANLSTKHTVQRNGTSLLFTIDRLSSNSCSRPFPHPCEQTNTSSSSRLLSVKEKKR